MNARHKTRRRSDDAFAASLPLFWFIFAIVCGAWLLSPAPASAQLVFSTAQVVNSNAGPDEANDSHVRVATNSAGRWIAVWDVADALGGPLGEDADIFFAVSFSAGAAWTAAAALNSNAGIDGGEDNEPDIATDGAGNWVVVWHSGEATLGGGGGAFGETDIAFVRSSTNGNAWTGPGPLNSNASVDSGSDQRPRIAYGNGVWIVVWDSPDDLDGQVGADVDILYSRSVDGGVSWSAPAGLNPLAGSDFAFDQRPHVATDGMGNWVVVWDTSDTLGGTIGSDSDIVASRSTDGGVNWTLPVAVNSHAATDDAFIDSDLRPRIASDGAGRWVTVWEGNLSGSTGFDNDLFAATSTDLGANWGTARLLTPTDTGNDTEPTIATDGRGNWLAVWRTTDNLGGSIGTDDDIVVSHSTDGGATWDAPTALNVEALTDNGNFVFDFRPHATADGLGNWLVVYESSNTLGDTIDFDLDILSSLAFLAPNVISDVAQVDFGTVDIVGGGGSFDVIIRNLGNDLLTFTGAGVELTGADAADFAIVADTGETQLTAGSLRRVTVGFAPSTVGSKTAALRVTTDDPDEATLDIALTGVAEERNEAHPLWTLLR